VSGPTARAARSLATHLPQRLVSADHPDFDAARSVYFTGVDRRPAAIVRPHSAEEVAEAVRIIAGEGARISVKGGGHGFASLGVADGVIALDLSEMTEVTVDPKARVARAGGGATTGAYTAATGRHGLATGFGDSPKVGIGGITQSGGIGFLHRRCGLTVDALLGAQLVTAAGEILEVDGERRPDLFWALRGGGGGFGVVTRLDFRLHPVDRVTGGMFMAPADAHAFGGVLELMAEAPDELSGIVQALRAPPAPFIPEELHGRMLLGAYVVHCGEPEEGERWMARLRAVAPPVSDELGLVPYATLFDEAHPPPAPPHLRWRSAFRDPLSSGELNTLFAMLETPHDGIMRTLQLRPMGGAVSEVTAGDTAFAHRDAPLLASVGAVYGNPEDAELHTAWVAAVHDRLTDGRPYASYAGFLGADDPDGVAAAWPVDHRERLLEVKERYDPDRRFTAPSDPRPASPSR
jgi:FAD/FMN-containing dehydrogenase